ncbi:MAG: class B sortase [Clostridia bacterium]|nr:class B sortase [Clostridia bacterium]
MSGDEFAAARHLAPEDTVEFARDPAEASPLTGEPGAGLAGNNVFTPISVAERLRNQPLQGRTSRGSAALPPMRPGQLYGYGPSRQEELYPPVDSPIREQMAAAQKAEQTTEGAACYEEQELRQYQQAYWEHLRNTSGLPVAGSADIEKHAPAYLYGVDDPLTHAAAETSQPPMEYEYESFFNEENLSYPHVQDEKPFDLWHPDEPVADSGFEEFGEPSRNRLYTGDPKTRREENLPQPDNTAGREDHTARQQEAGVRTQDRDKGILHRLGQLFTSQPPADLSPRRLAKVLVYGVLVLLVAFFTIQAGQIVLALLHNEQEMKMVREEYYALNGIELEKRASRVDLPPPGITFPPVQTPRLEVTPAPTPVMAQREGPHPNPEDQQAKAATGSQEPSATLNPRNKATRYENNPLTNILESFVEQRKENPDIIGHLTVDGLMDETVMMRNNTYYLTHDEHGSFSEAGMVFVDEGCSLKNPPENLHLRGQSKAEGRVFAPLWTYRSGGIDFVRRHGLVQVDTLYEEELYVVFAVIETTGVTKSPDDFNYGGYPSFQTDAQMESHVAAARRSSLYEIPVDVLPSDRLLTLSTISGGLEDSVLVLMARKLRPWETAASLSPVLASARPKETD